MRGSSQLVGRFQEAGRRKICMRSPVSLPVSGCSLLAEKGLRQARRGAVSRARARPRRCFGRWAASRRRRSRSRMISRLAFGISVIFGMSKM
eukprot:4276488-Prymnesium_polylepis.1